jgi:hypothetical protein
VGFDDDPLPLIGSLHRRGDFVENAITVRLKLSRAGHEQLVGRNLDADDFAVLTDVEAGNGNGRKGLADAVVRGDRCSATSARGCLNRVDLLFGFDLSELRVLEAIGHLAELPLQKGDLFLRRLPDLFGLGELAVQVGVVHVELSHPAIEILDLRSDGLRLLLLKSGRGSRLPLGGHVGKRPFLTTGAAGGGQRTNDQAV